MNPIVDAIDEWFADTSRSPSETLAGLEEAISHAEMRVEVLRDTGADDDQNHDC